MRSKVDPETVCESVDVSQEELMYVSIFSDENDIEGLMIEGNKGTNFTMRANGEISDRFRMKGRPVGFRVMEGPNLNFTKTPL